CRRDTSNAAAADCLGRAADARDPTRENTRAAAPRRRLYDAEKRHPKRWQVALAYMPYRRKRHLVVHGRFVPRCNVLILKEGGVCPRSAIVRRTNCARSRSCTKISTPPPVSG